MLKQLNEIISMLIEALENEEEIVLLKGDESKIQGTALLNEKENAAIHLVTTLVEDIDEFRNVIIIKNDGETSKVTHLNNAPKKKEGEAATIYGNLLIGELRNLGTKEEKVDYVLGNIKEKILEEEL